MSASAKNTMKGRWLTPDPLAGDITDPQSLNRYAYAFNNPTTLTDPTGRWPSWTHGTLTGMIFGSVLTSSQIAVLINASNWVDQHQGQGDAFMHSMCSPGQGLDACTSAITGWIDSNLATAQNEGLDNAGLFAFGEAAHTLEDMTSPAHTDTSGTPYAWYDSIFGYTNGSWIPHFANELSASYFDLFDQGQAIRNVVSAFWLTYPDQAASWFKSPTAWANSAIYDLVNAATANFDFMFPGGGAGLLEGEAWGCAMGNPAACGFDNPPVLQRTRRK